MARNIYPAIVARAKGSGEPSVHGDAYRGEAERSRPQEGRGGRPVTASRA
jgi:hypothetical protein